MPGIQVEFGAMEAAPNVARAAGVTSEDAIIAGLLRMWAQCCRTEVDRVTLVELSGLFGVPVENAPRLADALVAFRFLEPKDGFWRIRGAEDRIFRFKRARRAGGLAAKANLKNGGRRPAKPPAASRLEPGSSSADARLNAGSLVGGSVVAGAEGDPGEQGVRASRRAAGKRPPLALEIVPAPDRDWPELVEDLCAIFSKRRGGAKYDFSGQDAAALKRMREKHGAAAVREQWGRALDHAGFPTVAFLWELEKNWNHFSAPRPAPGGGKHARAENQNHGDDTPF